MAVSGARRGAGTWLRRLAVRALARDLPAYVAPDPSVARALGLDLAAAGLRLVPTPRHAAVLVLVAEVPEGLRRAAAVAYAQMPRPRAILAIAAGELAPLPVPDVAVPAEQPALARGVEELRRLFARASFGADAAAFDTAAVRTERRYTCPMHPEIVRDEPGKCPICGMNLIALEEAGGQAGHGGMATEPASAGAGGKTPAASGADAAGDYTCPMHPEVASAGPGSCPICGMDLVPRAAGDSSGAAAPDSDADAGSGGYTCPMHPEIVRAGPGSCPICGMDLVAHESPTATLAHGHDQAGAAAADGGYTCPMHPEVSSDAPGACPICGMDLVPLQAPAFPGGHRAEHPAPGAASDHTCPMHPEVSSDRPGSCPICGMDLVPRGNPSNGDDHAPTPVAHDLHAQPAGYTCPMHPEIVRNGPGSCPICGMDLVPREEVDASSAMPTAPHAGHRAAPAEGRTVPGDAAAPGRAGPGPTPREAGSVHAGHGDRGATSHGDHATMAGEPGGEGRGEMGHGRTAASAALHTSASAAERHGETAHGAGDMAGMDHSAHTTGDTGDMHHGGHGMADTGGMEHGGHDMGAMGGTDHSAHEMGGFMSMVALTRDLPRSRDGLPMEWVEVPFGPLFPGLPGGLALRLTLDGDVVARAARAGGHARRGLDTTWPGPRATFPERLARLDPLAPVAYRQLAWRALEAAAGQEPGDREVLARIGAIERERAASHLAWLAGFAGFLGIAWLAERAAALQLAAVRAADPAALAPLREQARRLADRAARLPLLRRRLGGVGRPGDAGGRRGPVARAAREAADERAADPAYRALGFAPCVGEGDDALARLLVRLREVGQSLDLAIAAGPLDPAGPTPDTAGGRGMAALETPRGPATLHLVLEGGAVREAHLDAPSVAHAPLIAAVAEGRELADALAGIASLDLSPWELDR